MKKFFLLGLILGTSACVSLYAAGIHSVVKSQVKDLDKIVLEKGGGTTTTTTIPYDGVYDYITDVYDDQGFILRSPVQGEFTITNSKVVEIQWGEVSGAIDSKTGYFTGKYLYGGNPNTMDSVTMAGSFNLTNQFQIKTSADELTWYYIVHIKKR